MTRGPAAASDASDDAPDDARRAHSNPLLALIRLVGILAVTASFLLVFLFRAVFVHSPRRRFAFAARSTQVWGGLCSRVAGYRLVVHGEIPPPGAFLTPNHLGYVDIIVLAACVPCLYVAKAEVASWPLFGLCCRLFDHVFVVRRRTRDLVESAARVRERLRHGTTVCAFLEGTSSGGRAVLPFRASFVQPAIDVGVPVVPAGVRWTPSDPAVDVADDIAYWRDHTFLPHLWRHLGLRGLRVDVHFGAPIATEGIDRKILAEQCRDTVCALTGFPARERGDDGV